MRVPDSTDAQACTTTDTRRATLAFAPLDRPGRAASDDGDDSDALNGMRCGDPAACAALFRRYAPALCAFLARYVGSSAVAEDLVQDLFLALWDRREVAHITGSARTYLFAAARNRALNHLKRERIAERFRTLTINSADMVSATAPAEADLIAAMELQAGLDQLPPRCRLIFSMSRQQHMTYGEIAVELHISIKTVEVQMGRALKRLRARALHTQT